MVTKVVMPKWGYILEGEIIEWLKNEGDEIEKGDPLFVVETEKVTEEVESTATGILLKIFSPVGSLVPVGEVVAAIGDEEEGSLAERLGHEKVGELTGSGKAAEVKPSRSVSYERRLISPAARRLAREHGLDTSTLTGTGPRGRIVRDDVIKALEASPAERGPEIAETVPLSGKRKTVSDRMSKSARETAQVTINMEIDAANMSAIRGKSRPEGREKSRISYTDLVVWATSRALRETPIMNSALGGDVIKIFKDVNVGVAVALDQGLIVPVIHDTDSKTLLEIATLRKDLVERARRGRLSLSDVMNGTFTVTNLGIYDVDAFTPIVNPPQTGILGIGRIREKPVVKNGEVAIRPVVTLSLSFDHRVVDGAPAARFLQRIKQLLENPAPHD